MKPSRAGTILSIALALLCGFALTPGAHAHIGSKDVFQQVEAGPYKLYVTVRTPVVIPGIATIEVRSSGAPVRSLQVTPLPITGEAAKHPPTPDTMQASPNDPAFFTGSLWLMESGSWQVRMAIDGAAGKATAGVPVPAVPLSVLPMQRPLAILLAVLGLILVLGMASIVAGAVRESRLPPGAEPTPARRRKAAIASGLTLALLAFAVYFGDKWWKVDAASYAEHIYQPSDLHATLNGDTLTLQTGDYSRTRHRWVPDSPNDFLLDHGHLMHLYAIRQPAMDAAFHLHPAPAPGSDSLSLNLPAMPPGQYKLYADLVYRNGFPETLTTTLTIPPGLVSAPLASEDASATPPALSSTVLGPIYKLPDGYTMVWDRPAAITANTGYTFRFTLLNTSGKPAADVQPYLGMAGHAAWVKTDGTTFAHTHPEGSAAMPALMLAQAEAAGAPDPMDAMKGSATAAPAAMPPMPGMDKPLPPTVEFPYGFPAPGRYRVFIQMKHSGTVETGVFDAEVR